LPHRRAAPGDAVFGQLIYRKAGRRQFR